MSNTLAFERLPVVGVFAKIVGVIGLRRLDQRVSVVVVDQKQEGPPPRRVVGLVLQNSLDLVRVLDHFASLADPDHQRFGHTDLPAVGPYLVQRRHDAPVEAGGLRRRSLAGGRR